jgi:NitT/TauT family transport system substrate-binding protein
MLDQYLARDGGFYRREELDVENVIGTENPSKNPAEMLASGEIDFAVAGLTILLSAIRNKIPLKYLLFTRKDPPHRLVARPHIMTAADLRGKLIGVARGTALYYHLIRRWLKENGLDPDRDVRFLERNPGSLKDFHIESSPWARDAYWGAADAFLIDEVKRELYQALGFHELVETYERYPNSSTHGLVTTPEKIEADPDLVMRFVRAHTAVARWIHEQASEVVRYIAERWKISEPVAARCYQRMKTVFIADADVHHVTREIEVMRGVEGIGSIPDFEPRDFIEPKFADAVRA